MTDRATKYAPTAAAAPLRRRKRSAFTLIELIVVVVVIGLLAAIAVVSYSAVRNNTYDAAAEVTVASLAREVSTLGAFDLEISEDDVLAAAADVPAVGVAGSNGGSQWTLQENPGVPSTSVGSIAWILQGDAVGFAVLTQPGHAVYGCATLNYTDTRIDKTDTATANPANGLPCTAAGYSGEQPPDTAPPTGPYPITAVGGDATIEVTWPIVANVVSYEIECWTDAQGEGNGTFETGAALATSTVLHEMENYVWHTCRVTATLADTSTRPSDPATALPAGTPVSPVGEDVEFDPETDFGFCPSCTDHPFEAPTNPAAEGLWDLSSFYSTHAGDHRLYAVDRGTGAVITVLDTGAPSVSADRIGFREAGSSAPVVFDQPSGLAYGSHPARRAAASSTSLFSVIYLTDAADGTVWMLDVKAARAYQVATGFTAPTGVTWSMCANPTTGADETTVEGAVECLYVSTTTGIFRVPLTTTVDANGSTQPVATTAAASVQVSPTASVKVFATSATLLSGETSSIALRDTYGSTTSATATGTGASGAVLIPESISGVAGGLVVFADAGTHQIKRFDLNTPGAVTVIAGSGVAGYADATGLAAQFNAPRTVHSHGNWPFVYVADTGNGAIRKLNVVTGAVTTVYGTRTTTFAAIGSCEPLTVEPGSSFMIATLSGAQGGTSTQGTGGLGGRIRASIPVTSGEELRVCVGGQGTTVSAASPAAFNGGAASVGFTGAGGGATDIRRDSIDGIPGNWSLADRILVAGGGGGAAWNNTCSAWSGHDGAPGSGGRIGGDARTQALPNGGLGAVDGNGGFGGFLGAGFASDGTLGVGGSGGSNGSSCSARRGGGGGGGYYGGGGGGAVAGTYGGGGGGGNGYADASASGVSSWSGVNTGAGQAQMMFTNEAGVSVTEHTVAEQEFFCVNRLQKFRVPANATQIAADLSGAQGGTTNSAGGTGGLGGRMTGNLTGLVPNSVIEVNVGCQPTSSAASFGGGGAGATLWGAGGGGTDLRIDSNADLSFALTERVMVAGGGGGAAMNNTCSAWSGYNGGAGTGGTAAGSPNTIHGGRPARGTQPGEGGPTGSAAAFAGGGALGVGGTGTSNGLSSCSYRSGGGGGGGYYGGGGGGGVAGTGGGGGGGNGYASAAVTALSTYEGTQTGHGSVILNWASPISAATEVDVTSEDVVSFVCLSRTQRIVVPQSVSTMTVELAGAPGGTGITGLGGGGGRTTATVAVTPLSVVQVNVGCTSGSSSAAFGGGGAGSGSAARGGGGASDIRFDANADLNFDLSERALIAAGGGGAGYHSCGSIVDDDGGAGGLLGLDGIPAGGTGASDAAPGFGAATTGVASTDGALGVGGIGGTNGLGSCSYRGGGGGGGGLFGGGGGGHASGGGGGSSYADPGAAAVTFATGTSTAAGGITITFNP